MAILTTDRGLLTDEQCQESQVGGEVLCHVCDAWIPYLIEFT